MFWQGEYEGIRPNGSIAFAVASRQRAAQVAALERGDANAACFDANERSLLAFADDPERLRACTDAWLDRGGILASELPAHLAPETP